MNLKTDCRYFPGDRPCVYNKTEGKVCSDCEYYEPVEFRILIIKLDAVGDVLRTTSILKAYKRKYPNAYITWLTKRNAAPLLDNNPFVDKILILEESFTLALLLSVYFDIVFNPDASPASAALTSAARGKVKKGFELDSNGKVQPINSDAKEWLELGAFDQLKKANRKTYQRIIHEIAGLNYQRDNIQLFLNDREVEFKNKFKSEYKIEDSQIVIGLNTGAGSRWQLKQWTLQGFQLLISELLKDKSNRVLLYGGPEESDRNDYLCRMFPRVIDTGSENSLRHFFALLDLSDIVVTGDTMALHAAAALNKQTICLFGPTSSNEIEDYGLIQKIYPELDCLVCYKQKCDFAPNCMESISAAQVLEAVEKAKKNIRGNFNV